MAMSKCGFRHCSHGDAQKCDRSDVDKVHEGKSLPSFHSNVFEQVETQEEEMVIIADCPRWQKRS